MILFNMLRAKVEHGFINGDFDARNQLVTLLDAIKYAHEQRADDRCWMDVAKVYEAAGLPPPDTSVGDKSKMLANCMRYVDRYCTEGDSAWRSYAELGADNDLLRQRVRDLEQVLRNLPT